MLVVGHIICPPDGSKLGRLIFQQPVGGVHPPVARLLVLWRVAADEPGVAVDEVRRLQSWQHLLHIGCNDCWVVLVVNAKLGEPERCVVVAAGVLLQDGHNLVGVATVLVCGDIINPTVREHVIILLSFPLMLRIGWTGQY